MAVFLPYCRDFGCSTRASALRLLRDHRPGTPHGHFWDLYGLDPGLLYRNRVCGKYESFCPPVSTSESPSIYSSTVERRCNAPRDRSRPGTRARCPMTRLTHRKQYVKCLQVNYASRCTYWPAFSQAAPCRNAPSNRHTIHPVTLLYP